MCLLYPSWLLLSDTCCRTYSQVSFMLQMTLTSVSANYWSLLVLLCQQLVTFKPCSSLHCTSQEPFRLHCQMLSLSLRGCRTEPWSFIWHQSHNEALSHSALLYIDSLQALSCWDRDDASRSVSDLHAACAVMCKADAQLLRFAVDYVDWCSLSALAYHIFY